ncbi:nucleolar protein 10 [Homalodisca vitripennis]|uniref:nucleolar protein 10 n=1 Tax=Homalodisca vitripennis TaxID=197043 RepID=UPI001EECCD49|nr:nucleolar protein 10 [Homalodisca vitripennis]
MQVSDPNNVKIYNLSAGKSLPDWLSDRKRRALQNKDIDVRRRIELIQDFSMPGLSTSVKLSPDNNYILTTGIYKPRVRCYDVNNLSMKFERCFDSEVVTFQVLSDDYSKLVFLQCDRYVEFHSAGGRYFRLRIPKFGRDMRYHLSTCDLYLVGSGSDIYRLNLELGQFLNPFMSEASEINKVAINPVHRLVAVGTREGKVEAWDPRSRGRVGLLDCALSAITPDTNPDMSGFPSVTALEFHGALNLSVGTASGQVLLYDVRSDKPLRVKDHMYGLPIRDIAYCQDHVLSMDSSVIKIWNKDSGTLFTSIEAGNITQFNNLCSVPNSGLMFIANEAPKLLTYYIPSLGPAPKWCGFLDNLTEELEETVMETVYDDYKFVTKNELEDLGLSHLIGTNLLRGYMHGYFIDIRLYRKAKSVAEPFAFEEYRRRKIREKIEEERKNRVQIQKLPKVNKDLALKLMNDASNEKKKKKNTGDLLADDRFKDLFENPDFQVDKNAEEYRLLNPVLSRLDKAKVKEMKKKLAEQFEPVEDEEEGKASSEGESMEDSSSEDDQELSKELRRTHRQITRERRQKEWEERKKVEEEGQEEGKHRQPKFYELKAGEEFGGVSAPKRHQINKATLEERLKQEYQNNIRVLTTGNREMTFTVKKKGVRNAEAIAKHHEERKQLMRPPPKGLARSKFFSGMKRRR